MLARRYLNPRRAFLSSFTLISLVGVLLGVLVLVVVMAVYAGLEKDVKSRLLGFTPHILLRYQGPPFSEEEKPDWQDIAKKALALPHIEGAAPFVSDNVIIDVESFQRPVMFRGVDAADASQIEGIDAMLDRENFPNSSADLGLDDRVVISSTLAEQFHIGVGDHIRLYSTRNFEEVMRAYKATENPPLREAYAAEWQAATTPLADAWRSEGDARLIPIETLADSYNLLAGIREDLRQPEQELLDQLLLAMEQGERDDTANAYRFTAEEQQAIPQAIAALNATDAEKMDGDTLKSLKQVVLPKEAEVVGVYLASQMAIIPDLFVPLPLAQDLAGIGDNIHDIALRVDDSDKADGIAAMASVQLGPHWRLITWGEQYQAFFALINQQRAMMYFALSFIVLVSAFSMMAVMFTVTIQKRREIGVMKALGAAPSQIVRVFLYQGMILGIAGAILGVGFGRLVIHFRGAIQSALRTVGFDPFSASFTGFGVLPAYNNPLEQAAFAIMAFVLCSIAAIVPAFFAARSDAAKSLRNL